MSTLPLQFLVLTIAGWVNRGQQDVIGYLQEESRIFREHLGGRRLLFSDAQRRRLTIDTLDAVASTCLPDRYDDGGFSGGTIDRPALRRLLTDVEAGRVDASIVYKVDRLSRSLLDFARILGILEKQSVAFVSITQAFNSATSAGRLMLNILL